MRAPATSANLGPGFDCAAAAFDLWNELRVTPAVPGEPLVVLDGVGADELPHDASHLALRAFALVTPIDGYAFHFLNRIPLERGLGSSAATVAAGLVAGMTAAGSSLSIDELLALGLPLEGHADNLVAALRGGVCLNWTLDGRTGSRQLATRLPLDAIAVVPNTRVNTKQSRSRLPETVSHADAATAAGQGALLGAAIAAGDAALLAAAFHDVLHEPYRLPDAPILADLRTNPVDGMVGATLSGSGPTVIVWADPARKAQAVQALEARGLDATVHPLEIARTGAEAEILEPVGATQ